MIVLLVFLTIIAVVADVAVGVLLLRWLRSRYRRRYRFQIDNLGNVPAAFDLRVRLVQPGVSLSFGSGVIVPDGLDAGPISVQAQEPVQKTATVSNAAGAGKKIGGTVRKVRGASQMISGLIAGIGGLLPASIGQPLRDFAAEMRKRQIQVNRIENAPRQTTSRVKAVTRAIPSQRSGSRSRGQSGGGPATSRRMKTGVQPGPVDSSSLWGQTEQVISGETATVEVLASPPGWPRQAHDYPIKVESYVVGQPSAPIARQDAHIRIPEVSWFEHIWPYLVYVLALILEIWLLVSLFAGLA